MGRGLWDGDMWRGRVGTAGARKSGRARARRRRWCAGRSGVPAAGRAEGGGWTPLGALTGRSASGRMPTRWRRRAARVLLDAGRPRAAWHEIDRCSPAGRTRRPPSSAAAPAWRSAGPSDGARDFGRAIAGMPAPRPEQVFALPRRAAVARAAAPRRSRRSTPAWRASGASRRCSCAAVDLEVELGRYDAALATARRA